MKEKIRIGIDCRLAGKQHAGIGRYIENLVQNLPSDKNICWVLFFYDQIQADEVLNSSPFGRGHLASKKRDQIGEAEVSLAPIRHYSLAEQLKLPKIFKAANLDLLHVPHFNIPIFYSGKLIVTIHDLLWHEQKGSSVTTLPKWQYYLKYLAYKFVTKKAILKSAKIIVPSETIKNTLLKYYPEAQNKILVVKEGVAEKFSLDKLGNHSISTKDKQKSNKNLLYVGSLYPHKNLKLVFKALRNLPNYKLNIVSSRDAFQKKLAQEVKVFNLQNQVFFLGQVSDEKLIKLYQSSLALIQPSLSEGFGLTGIEAMAVGCPVLASNILIFKEIYSDAAIYFDPHSANSFIKALKKLEIVNREKIIQKGKEQARQYSWEDMTASILNIYKKLCQK